MMLFLTVIYVLVAIAMVALILMQRGAGAQAGSGFGGGASATVFGARGASSFLSKATKWLAITFFAISLFMAWHATDRSRAEGQAVDLGVMSQVPVAPAAPQGDAAVPVAPAQAVPAPAAEVPAAPVTDTVPQSPESAPSEPAGE
ncbi:preprotein translocase subunit SecG [Lysobacter arseniciresistens ZS79]|uniref:Protein-export membrane protein SecG n=1 Tax=Lysobacter arseniciresistens ZS79 TaxID=913325 RepID=A0A0A0F203_9GAMM|nr:preprotein translocase subunit SecG [Lysobacter arseniciresistens]KGM57196.1 preprotein translocase subunit SecG [Lysobacter arseniciresistens ZS79]